LHQDELNIADIRKDYRHEKLDENSTGEDPLLFFTLWFAEAKKAKIDEVNAMTLATVDENNKPHARIVLLKGLDLKGFVFFTNYNSAKGRDIHSNPHAALVFFWKELERQVRIEGIIEKISQQESDEYFKSRPKGSQIGAWSSPQSQIISERQMLDDIHKQYEEEFKDKAIPRPAHWGGYRLIPSSIEFWQGRTNRLHDRIFFTLDVEKKWQKCRLAP
jgi:pyridoxamine 5'-phosphate oxidase